MAGERSWSLGFWQCLEEPVPCSLSVCCLCFGVAVIQYQNQQKAEGKGSFGTALTAVCGCCFGMAWNRGQLRTALGLEEAYWSDCGLYALCCCPCLSVQEYRQVGESLSALQAKDN